MRVIFLSESAAALSVNGVYLGVADGFERTCELDPKDRVFCELKPSGRVPVSFFFDEAFLISPPPQIKLYFFAGGVAVYAGDYVRSDASLEVVWQKRLGGTLLTLCMQGKLQLNFENETGFRMIPLPETFYGSTACALRDGFLLECETGFALLSHDGKILLLSEGRILEKESVLKAEVPFHDSMRHTAVCAWEDGRLTECTIRTAQEPTEATFALALFESVLIGADCLPFLHPSLAEKADALREFLGGFESVVLTQERDKVGLVYRRKERVYDVRYFRVSTEDGKISNIAEI
jgi:hypothetical protein